MKKLISLTLSILMASSVIAPCESVIAAEVQRRDVNRFCNLVAELNEEYESDSASFEAKVNEDNPNAVENRLIIKTRKEISDTEAVDSVYGLDYAVLQYDDRGTMLDEYEELKDKGYTVQKDGYLHTYAESLSDAKWGNESIGSEYAKSEIINTQAYKNEIVVGVLDSGVNYNHELFADRITDTTFNVSGTGSENDCMDDYGHGTAVAGIIAQTTPDNVKIKPYKIMNNKGICTLSTFIAAIEEILASNDKPDIMNISLGSYDPYGDMIIQTELIADLIECGVTVCVASGNDNLPIEYITPANCETAITVGAYDSNNHICSFSNYGNEIDVAAPGEKIYTAGIKATDAYTTFTGTSAACPFASAACAYVLAQNPKLQPEDVQKKIKASAIYMGEDEEMYFGSGMLNLPNLLNDKEESLPVTSIKGGLYHDTQSVEFNNIPTDSQLVYTLDKSIPSNTNGTVYTEPVIIDNEMQLNYALIKDSKYVSNISSEYYTIQYLADENGFEITDNGEITAYNGNKNNIIVPDTINGITPTDVGGNAFKECNLKSIILPNTIKEVHQNCFYNSKELKHFSGNNVTDIGHHAFEGCSNLRDECMPNLYGAGGSAFKDCTMLHNVDFENSVEYFSFNVFQNSGLTNVNFPNVTECDIEYLFYKSTIMTCDISNNEMLSSYSFYQCNYLYELNAQSAIEIGYNIIVDTYYLDKLDLSSAVYIAESAFNRSYIDTLYAPECEEIFDYDMACGIGEESYIRVIDLPKLTRVTSRHLFDDMFVEEIYLESLEDLPFNAFINLPALKVLYLPKAKTFLYYGIDKWGTYPYSSPLEIVWIPSAVELEGVLNITDTTKLVYAPSLTGITADSYQATFVLSEKATRVDIGPTSDSYQDQVYPTIIAPENSAAWNQWRFSSKDPMTYIDSDSIATALGGEIRTRDNGLRLGFTLDESTLGFDLSEYKNLYSRINKEYGFVYTYNEVSDNTNTASWELRSDTEGSTIRKADRRDVNGNISHYNIVFTNIPSNHYDDLVSARAYICIDGMYFYSDVTTRSYSSVANAILNDDEMSQEIKDDVAASLEKAI